VDWASNPGTWTDPTTFPSQTADITAQKPTYSTASVSMTVYDSSYAAHTVTANFEHMGNDQWALHIDPQPDGTIANGVGSILLNFDGRGNITGVSQTDPVTGAVTTSATNQATSTIVWNNSALGTSPLTFDLTQLTQLEGDKPTIKGVEQDGFAAGTYSYARFDGAGKLSAFYSNGHSKVIFQVPVASFTAPDSLNPVSGNLFQRTPQAGAISVGSVEDQGSGAAITAGALESSNVNLENEFTKMIITQRAYSSNATVFKTADEMTQTTRDLYR
jgi:flagellar hook protein FlgE